MTKAEKNRVCPAENAGVLEIKIRKFLHNPQKILKPYIFNGMKVLDLGCGPGYFTIDMAKMVGKSGKVIAVDLQEEMLERLKKKIQEFEFQNIIKLHKCESDRINLAEKVDFILIFYMLHEVPDQLKFLKEVNSLLKPGGIVLISEPKFHVSKKGFDDTIERMNRSGFEIIEKPKIFFSRSVVIKNKS